MAKLDKLVEWFEERFRTKEDVRKILKKPVPKHAMNPIYCLGGIALFSYLVLVFTGILLARYYVPTPESAYDSIKYIMEEVAFGSLFRSIHHWAANTMMAAVILHMFRVYFTGTYKKPRELNWLVGASLLLTTMIFGFSGYLLPWDQLSFWATTVGLQIPAAVPVVGPVILNIFIGGSDVGAETLVRFYFLHVFLIPMIVFMLMGIHFLMVRRQGISESL